MIYIKNFTYGEGGQGALSIQKNEKITRTVPMIKSNSNFYTIFIQFFSSMIYIKIFTYGEEGQGPDREKNDKYFCEDSSICYLYSKIFEYAQ